jgi:hypothetical protein
MDFDVGPASLGGQTRRLLQDTFTSVSVTLRPLIGQEATLSSELQDLARSKYMPLITALHAHGMLRT